MTPTPTCPTAASRSAPVRTPRAPVTTSRSPSTAGPWSRRCSAPASPPRRTNRPTTSRSPTATTSETSLRCRPGSTPASASAAPTTAPASAAWTRQYAARTTINMQAYNAGPYPGLQLDRLTARVTYNSGNTRALEFIETNDRGACRAWVITKLVLSFGFAEGTNCANSTLQIGSCNRDAPMTDRMRSWDVDVTGCVTQAQLQAGIQTQWISRPTTCASAPSGSAATSVQIRHADLDGVELLPRSPAPTVHADRAPERLHRRLPQLLGRRGLGRLRHRQGRQPPTQQLLHQRSRLGRPPEHQGTIYAPSAAFEIDELDSAYSLHRAVSCSATCGSRASETDRATSHP